MTLHITHNDLDGIACGILVKSCIPSVTTRYTHYDELENIISDISPAYSNVIISDLGPSKSSIEMLAGEKEFVLIDHHLSTKELAGYPFVVHSLNKCAALLTYEYLLEQGYDVRKFENFVNCVNDFDLWLLKRADSLKMNMLLTLYGTARFEKRFLAEPYTQFKPEEEMIIALEEERRNNYITRAMKNVQMYTDKDNRQFAVIYAEQYISELGNHILMDGIAKYVLLLNPQRMKASLRSVKDVDISRIAMSMGGGGHKNAAGFNIDFDFALEDYLYDIGLI